ncbi:MAG: methyl-accepting chemotaxis protein, partial [Candidatus Heimdallarchaeota archaeon]|nr:methyl-accepting chemotaxis protein [Candidatus Heimdallarchaeota archaeon]
MASILKISIRNRLLLISLATIFLLSVQSGLIFDAQSKLQWLDDKGIEHLNREDKMLLDIYEFNYTIASYIQLEYRSYLYTLLSHDQHEPSTYELDYIIEEINTFYHNLLERENIGTNITTYETQQNSNYTALQNFAKNFENIYNLSDFNEELEVFKTVVSDIARRDAADYRTVLGERINSTKEFGQQSSMMHHMYGTNMFNSGKAVEDGFNYLENNDSLLLSSINEKNNFTIKYELINQYYAIKNDITSLINEWTYNQLGWSGNSSQGHDVIIDSLNLFLDSLNQRNETITNNLILFRNHQNLTTTEVNYVLDILNSFLNLIIPNLQNSITNQIGLITIEMQIENTIETDFNVLGQTVKRLLDQTLINIRSDRDKFLRILSEVKALLIEELNTLTVQSVLWIISLIVFTLIPTVLILRSRINKLLTKTQTISEGDLNIKIASKYGSDEFGRIEKIFDEMVLELRNFMITARRTSNTLSGIAEELAAGSEEASASIRDVAN